MRTRHLSLVTSTPSDTMTSTSTVPSPYGPVRAGLTISRTTQDQQLTELLRCLESVVASLNSKSCTLLDTLNTAIQGVSVALNATPIESVGTENC